MILVLLVTFAFWSGIYSFFGWEGVIVVAGLCTLGTFLVVFVEDSQSRYDRRVALERWEGWTR